MGLDEVNIYMSIKMDTTVNYTNIFFGWQVE